MQRIIHVVTIHVERSIVFEAIATVEGLSNWWSTQVIADEKSGGVLDFRFLDGFNPDMKITEHTKPERIIWECISGHEPWHDNIFSFDLSEVEDGTRLQFTQQYAREISDLDYGIYNFNWAYYLQSLKDYCEIGKGKPFEPNP